MRKKRELNEGATYHVIARINRNEFILRAHAIKVMLLQTISRARKKYDFELINICIMDNHIHMMIKPSSYESLSRIMQWILSVFAVRYNRTFSLKGHVWYDRFKSKIIRSLRQFIATFDYIDENPVKAGIAVTTDKYPYGGMALMANGVSGVLGPPSLLVQLLFPGFCNPRIE